MDGPRFDDLTRALGAAGSRRTLLRATASAAIGLLSVAEFKGVHASSCGTFCNALPPGRQRGECARACGQDIPGGLFAECDGDQSRLCQAASGTFACCAGGETCCDGVCIDTQRDEANCGACGTTCHPHATCFDGVCRCCQGGTVECGQFSTDQICCDFPLTAVKCCNALCDDPGLDCVLFCIDCGIGLECDYSAFCPPGYGLQPGAGGPVPGACVG